MQTARSRILLVGLALWTPLALSCGNKDAAQKVTEADCRAVSQHIADMIIDDKLKNPPSFYDAVTAGEGPSDIPSTVTRDSFKAWLDTPEGKTWLLQRRGQTLAGTQQGIGRCVERAKPEDVKCFLAATSKEAVNVCDAKAQARDGKAKPATPAPPTTAPPTPTSGSADAGAGSGSAEEKPAAPPTP